MSDPIYNLIVFVGRPIFNASSDPLVLHRERIPPRGAFVLASNHCSVYDIPCLMQVLRRKLDFVSRLEFFRNQRYGWVFRNINALPLDRSRVDTMTTRAIVDRLRRGRGLAIFPEARVRERDESVLAGAPFNPAFIRLAQLANAPIIPTVILGTNAYSRRKSWLPLQAVRHAVNFGLPLDVSQMDRSQAIALLRQSWMNLHRELREHPRFPGSDAAIVSKQIMSAISAVPECDSSSPTTRLAMAVSET